MMTRKEMKKAAKRNLKRHYILLVAVCLIAAFLNSEFSGSLNSLEVNVKESSGSSSGDMGKVAGQQAGAMDVARNLLEGREKEGKELSRKIERQQIKQSEGESPVLGRSRGGAGPGGECCHVRIGVCDSHRCRQFYGQVP